MKQNLLTTSLINISSFWHPYFGMVRYFSMTLLVLTTAVPYSGMTTTVLQYTCTLV